jgi:hypothetical protein
MRGATGATTGRTQLQRALFLESATLREPQSLCPNRAQQTLPFAPANDPGARPRGWLSTL